MNLNIVDSTEASPVTGPSDPALRTADSLSHPISSQDLFDQLSQWTNVNFDFSEQTSAVPASTFQPSFNHFDSAQDRLGSIKGKSYERGFSTSTPAPSYIDPNAVFTAPFDPALFNAITPAVPFPTSFEPIQAPVQPELIKSTSSAVTKTKAPKKGKKVTPVSVAAPSPASTTTTPEADSTESKGIDPDDKRRRNTLASARFRIKKKEREAATAKDLKEAVDKVAVLEKEVDVLKRENAWLRSLIVEKAKPGSSLSTASS